MTNANDDRPEQVLNAFQFILESITENNISVSQIKLLNDDEVSEFGEIADFGVDEFERAIDMLNNAAILWYN